MSKLNSAPSFSDSINGTIEFSLLYIVLNLDKYE